jgi:hypothetical protein
MTLFLSNNDALAGEVPRLVELAQEWLSEEPLSRAILAAEWARVYGTPYEPTAENYRAAVRLVAASLHDPRAVLPPVWVRSGGPHAEHFSAYGSRMVDGLVFHAADMLGATEFGWAIDVDSKSGVYGSPYVRPHLTQTVPGLVDAVNWLQEGRVTFSRFENYFSLDLPDATEGDHQAPLRDDEAVALAAVRGKKSAAGLRGLLGRRSRIEAIELPAPISPRPHVGLSTDKPTAPPTVEELLPGVYASDMPGYTHEIWVDEAAEHTWGEAKFVAYEAKLAQQPGIEAVLGEDREIIHVNAPTLTDAQVLAAARAAAG